MFEVTREQLEKIKEDQGKVSLDSNITVATATAFLSIVSALGAGVNNTTVHAIFVVAAIGSVITCFICGFQWHKRVKNTPSTVDRILARSARSIDPESGLPEEDSRT